MRTAVLMRLFQAIILLLCLSSPAFGQNRQVIDSLMQQLSSSTDSTLARVCNAIAWEYRWYDLDSALKYARLGESLSRRLNFKDGLAQNQNFTGVIYFNRGDLSKAMDFFFNALQHAEQPPRNSVEAGYALNNIGNVYKQQGALPQAIEYMSRALQEFEAIDDKRGIAYCCIRLAETYELMADYDTALKYAYRTLRLREETRDRDGIQSIRIRLGIIYSKIGDYDKALGFHFAALQSLQETNSRWGIATSLNNIAQIYLKQGQLDTALSHAEACFKIAKQFNSKEKLMDVSRTLGEIYAAKHEFEKAYTYLKLAEALKDSVLNEQNVRAVANMQALYDMQRRQSQIELLKKENENQGLVRNSLVGSVIFLLVIVVLSVYSYRQKRHAAAQYKAQNEYLTKLNVLLAEERHKAEAQRQRAEEASMFKTEILSIVAHDLKNPLQSILGFSALILEELDSSHFLVEKIKAIRRAAERMLILIKDLLQNAAIESRNIQLKVQKVLIADLLHRVLDANRLQAEMKLQQLDFQVLSPDAVAEIDLTWMREVFENLISNAIKFTPIGKRIRVTVSERENYIRIEFKDEGQGLTDDDMQKLFGKFQRLSAQPTGNETSTGLGLSIAKQLVELHHGRIWAESAGKDLGSTFIVELPKVQTDEQSLAQSTTRF